MQHDCLDMTARVCYHLGDLGAPTLKLSRRTSWNTCHTQHPLLLSTKNYCDCADVMIDLLKRQQC
jgi:hypothetical protein